MPRPKGHYRLKSLHRHPARVEVDLLGGTNLVDISGVGYLDGI